MTNKEVAQLFETLADLLELSGENSFKVKTYRIAAFRINNASDNILEMPLNALKKIPNIGPAVLSKIEEIKLKGTISQLESLLQTTPPGIIDILQIKGIGPNKVRQLWLELEIESLGELAYACQENRLVSIKGFGQKTQDKILKNINFILANKNKFLRAEVINLAHDLWKALSDQFQSYRFGLIKDFARNNNILTTIALITDCPLDLISKHLSDKALYTIIRNNTQLKLQSDQAPGITIDYVENSGYALTQFKNNCSEEFLEAFEKQYTYPLNPQQEAEIFEHNGLQYISPPKREIHNWPAVIEDGYNEKNFIQKNDIRGLIHCHSNWSDGTNSIIEMANACIKMGLEYMVLTDHSISAFYAHGLSVERIAQQHKEIDSLNEMLSPFRIFKGIEADIKYDGTIDYDQTVWPSFEVIIASIHSNLRMDEQKATERILTALENPYVTILGHITGRLLLSRAGYPIDHKRIIETCADRNIAIEINAHPRRLDLDWSWVNYALEKGVMISINPDAHSIDGIQDIYHGINTAQKTLLKKSGNLSSFGIQEFRTYLSNRTLISG